MQLSIIFYITLLLPMALISGPLIPEILMLIATTLIFLKIKILREYINLEKRFLLFSFALCIYLILISFIADNYFLSFKNTIPYFRFFILTLIIFLILDTYNIKFFKLFFIIYFFVFLILCFDGYISFVFGENLFGLPQKPDRISSFFGDEHVMGSFTVRIVPFVLVSLLFCDFKIKTKSLFFIIILILSIFIIIMSGERTALALFLIFLFSLSLEKSFRKHLIKTYIALLIITISSLLFFSNSSFVNRIFYDTFNQVYKDGNLKFFSTRHEDHYLTSLLIFQDHPIFGSGPNSFRIECSKPKYAKLINKKIQNDNTVFSSSDGVLYEVKESGFLSYHILNNKGEEIIVDKQLQRYEAKDIFIEKFFINTDKFPLKVKKGQKLWIKTYLFKNGCNTHPHSIVLQLISETGLIGFLFLISFYIYLFKFLIISQKINNKKLGLGMYIVVTSLLINFFPLLPYGNFFHNWFSIVNFLPLGLFFYLKKLINQSKNMI